MKTRRLALGTLAVLFPALAHAQGYKKEIPDSLLAKARITEDSAAKIAMKRVPKGTIEVAALERSKGRVVWAYDLKVPGRSGAQEVIIDANSGKVVRSFHESAATERKEMGMSTKSVVPKPKKP